MRKSFTVTAALLLFALGAAAADEPRYEAFLGYNLVRFNPNSGFVPSFNANGGSGQFVWNWGRWKWVGLAVDAGAVHKGEVGGLKADTTVANFVVGPRFTYHGEHWTVFGNVMFGGAYGATSTRLDVTLTQCQIDNLNFPAGVAAAFLSPDRPLSARVVASNSGFAMMAGGGFDWRFNKHMSFRPIAVDYYLTRLPSIFTGNDTNRNNVRYSAGINFLFGTAH